MGVVSTLNIPKEIVTTLENAPTPSDGFVLQVRAGKVKTGALGGEITSAIYKQEHNGAILCTPTGLEGDEHAAHSHGGTERAVHQYNPDHYSDWQVEKPPEPDLFSPGAYGENLITTSLDDENVCIGDVYQVGESVLLEVSEPRHPCYKLNSRFKWPRALKRTIRSGRSGWNYRVLQTGMICKGDKITLLKRPLPQWSVMNVQRVIRGKRVPLHLLAECAQLPMTDLWLGIVKKRLREAPKTYLVVDSHYVTERVKKLTFALKEPLVLDNPAFEPYAFAQITFGSDREISRSYSIVDGDLYRFSLGVALDRESRGGSSYIHKELKIGDEIEMYPGSNPNAEENDRKSEEQCDKSTTRILVVGGIGITAFLPSIRDWESKQLPFHIHYAVPDPDQAAFLDQLPRNKTTLYAKSRQERLNIKNIVPGPGKDGKHKARIFCCGPSRMMKECQQITTDLNYPEYMVHFEDFGGTGGGELGEPFEIEVDEPETKRHETLTVPSNKTMLDVLTEAGFDVEWSCKSGACGACKVAVCQGDIDYKSTALLSKQKGKAMQACVDRGKGLLNIEID